MLPMSGQRIQLLGGLVLMAASPAGVREGGHAASISCSVAVVTPNDVQIVNCDSIFVYRVGSMITTHVRIAEMMALCELIWLVCKNHLVAVPIMCVVDFQS
jgi:hypothetical protein